MVAKENVSANWEPHLSVRERLGFLNSELYPCKHYSHVIMYFRKLWVLNHPPLEKLLHAWLLATWDIYCSTQCLFFCFCIWKHPLLVCHSSPVPRPLQAALPCCPHTVLPCRRSSSGAELCASTIGAASVKVFRRGFDPYLVLCLWEEFRRFLFHVSSGWMHSMWQLITTEHLQQSFVSN